MASEATQSTAPVHRFILLTDIAQSSRLAEQYGRSYLNALEKHNQVVEATVAVRAGEVYKQTGDGYLVLFETAGACLDAALALGEALGQLAPLAENEPLLVRLVLHAGELNPSGSEYFGPALNRVSRICQVCNPGQVLLSGVVAGYFGGAGGSARGQVAGTAARPTGYMLCDLGQHHLRDLAEPEQLYQLDSERFDRHEFPPLSTLDNRPNNLVTQPNHFIGRERELKELAALLLDDTRLLSITAPGGYGKSRLAAQLCANLLHRFEQGVFMAYLAPVRESLDVPTAIANALGYKFTAGRTPEQQLCDYLRAKELLLCLDNFEHLLDSATLVAELIKVAPKLKVCITSREPLRIEGEHIYRLEPLGIEKEADGHSDAELLFADRAALVKQGYTLTPENAVQVRQLCEHLSGIPLAIELAAAWMDGFTLDELHDELSSRLELEARTSDKPQRHQSLQACLDWSWNLLGESQQELLMRLSVFRGGFYIEAARAVLGMKGMALRAALLKLCDKSWLYSREVEGQTRFFLRDMLAHEYAFAKLEETGGVENSLFEQAVRGHAEYFVALAEREGPRLRGGGTPDSGAAQLAALRCQRLELDNIQEALDSALHREELSWLLPITKHLQLFLESACDYYALHDRCSLLLEVAQTCGHAELRLQAQLGLGRANWRLSNYAAAREMLGQALALSHELGDSAGQALSLNYLGIVEYSLGNYSAAWNLLEQAQMIYRELDDRYGEVSCVHNFGLVALWQDNYSVARELFDQALVLYSEQGHRGGEASCLNNLGHVEIKQGNYNAARRLVKRALEISRELVDRNGETVCLINLGVVEEKRGNYRAARVIYEQALAIHRELGNRSAEGGCLNNLGIVELCQGSYNAARELLEQALVLNLELGDRNGEAACLGNLGIVKLCQGSYNAARELLEQALVLNLELGNRNNEANNLRSIGILEINLGNCRDAQELLGQALSLFQELGDKPGIAGTCTIAGTVLTEAGHTRAGALAIYGGQHGTAGLGHSIEPYERQVLDTGLARFDAAAADGTITVAELSQWQAEAEAMSLDELAEFVLAELGKLRAGLPAEGGQDAVTGYSEDG